MSDKSVWQKIEFSGNVKKWAIVGLAMVAAYFLWDAIAARTVIDGSTGKPLAGVHVIFTFEGDYFAGVESRHRCYRVDEDETDKEGRFHVPLWRRSINPFLSDSEFAIQFYRPGYRVLEERPAEGAPFVMVPDAGTEAERWHYLEGLFTRSRYCGSGISAFRKGPIAAYRATYEELRIAAKNKADFDYLSRRIYDIDAVEVGTPAADENAEKRERQLTSENLSGVGQGESWMPVSDGKKQ